MSEPSAERMRLDVIEALDGEAAANVAYAKEVIVFERSVRDGSLNMLNQHRIDDLRDKNSKARTHRIETVWNYLAWKARHLTGTSLST